jgi:hypothetical protein
MVGIILVSGAITVMAVKVIVRIAVHTVALTIRSFTRIVLPIYRSTAITGGEEGIEAIFTE